MSSSSLVVTGRVIGALMLRDIQTRFGAKSANYIIAVLWPLGHIVVLLIIYSVTGRAAPVGNSAPRFFATGLIPFVMFNYSSRMLMLSVTTNRPLLGLPVVRLTDIILSRAILESITSFIVIVIFGFILYGLDIDIIPNDPLVAVAALFFNLIMSLGLGIINSVLVILMPFWIFAFVLMVIVFYITSGIVFDPEQLPEKFQYILSWNPLLQSVTWFRSAYYPGLGDHILDRQYLIVFGLVVFALGLAAERVLRPWLLAI